MQTGYHNLVSAIDVNRNVDSIEVFRFLDMNKDAKFSEFMEDMQAGNDSIELNLIKNNAYREGIILTLTRSLAKDDTLYDIVQEQQKTFGGSKLFYINQDTNKLLVIAVPGSMDGKLRMVVNRLNRMNEKVHRLNAKIKKENMDAFSKRHGSTDEKDKVINLINKNLRV